jgi:hypothetical protein
MQIMNPKVKYSINTTADNLQKLKVDIMEQSVDEPEDSGEMQYPHIAQVISDITIEPRKINQQQGNFVFYPCPSYYVRKYISTTKEAEFGKLLAPIIG